MSTLTYHEACEQCRFPEALGRLDIYTGEANLFCPCCGYRLAVRAAVDRQRRRADPEKRLWLKRDHAGRLIMRAGEQRGYGAYCLTYQTGVSMAGRFTKPVTRHAVAWFKCQLQRRDVDPARSYMTRANRQKVTLVFGKLPRRK